MKVLLLNGSRREKGCTYTALSIVAEALGKHGIDTEIIHALPTDDAVSEVAEKLRTADGVVFGSPVYWASPSGEMLYFLDRLAGKAGALLAHKAGAVVASARRAGTTAALDQLVKYPMISNMPVVSSQYWPMVHGARPEDVAQDEEGLQTMRQLARNLLWLLQCIAAGDAAGVPRPETEARKFTNFIR